jgi:hypothetical protein
VIGWFGEDIVDGVEDIATSAFDDLKKTVPGFSELAGLVDDFASGPVRDFARTGVGRVFLSAVASTLTGGLVPFLGPQLATAAFALPGLARGDDFVTAWTQEFTSRVKQTAQIVGSDAVGPLWKDQLEKANAFIAAHGIDLTQIDFRALAEAAGIREDLAAWLIAGAAGELDLFQPNAYDPVTGKHVPVKDPLQIYLDDVRRQAQARAAEVARAYSKAAAVKALPASSTSFAQIIQDKVIAPTTRAVNPDAPKTSVAGDVVLGLVIAGALGALYWWSQDR